MINKKLFFTVLIFLFLLLSCKQNIQNEQNEKLKDVEILVLDGVNGSPVSQVELKIFKKDKLENTLVVQDGKVNASLILGEFYDFKLEGRKNLKPYYAASFVSSYLIEEDTHHITILQLPLNKITKNTISPKVSEVKIENQTIEKDSKTSLLELKDVSFTLISTYPCEEIRLATPAPMMGLGYVPSTMDKENIALVPINTNIKENDHYISTYKAHLDSVKINEKIDIVIVAYDVAYNRVEHHVRILPAENMIQENENIKIEDLKLKLEMYPTPSSTLAIGKDSTTKRSTHYKANIFFDVKEGSKRIDCSSFALYRKERQDKDFLLVKKIENVANTSEKYQIIDTDGMLEEGKEYSYKILAFSKNGTKSSYKNTPEVNVKVRKPSPLILTAPKHNASIKHSDAKKLSYSFKIAEPQMLEDAKYMEIGFLLSERDGNACYACKFKYVFNKKGEDELYFAAFNDIKNPSGIIVTTEYSKKLSDYTSKPVGAIVDVNQIDGMVTLTEDFITLPINLVATPFSYKKGATYYWDIVDWGTVNSLDVTFEDTPCKVVCDGNVEDTAEVIYYFNDKTNGNNAWNGREVFSIRY